MQRTNPYLRNIDFLQKYSNKCIWKIISELHLLYPFYQLHIVFFDLDADRNVREFPENILQQSDLPVSARAVAPCRREDWKVKVTVHLHMRRHAHTRGFATYLCKMSPLISPYTEASPTRVEEQMYDATTKIWSSVNHSGIERNLSL